MEEKSTSGLPENNINKINEVNEVLGDKGDSTVSNTEQSIGEKVQESTVPVMPTNGEDSVNTGNLNSGTDLNQGQSTGEKIQEAFFNPSDRKNQKDYSGQNQNYDQKADLDRRLRKLKMENSTKIREIRNRRNFRTKAEKLRAKREANQKRKRSFRANTMRRNSY